MLRHGLGRYIQRFMASQPPNLDGASEWNRLAASLSDLAAVYGAAMPLPDGQQARRMNDREVQKAVDDLAKRADRFKQDLDTSLKTDTRLHKWPLVKPRSGKSDSLKQDAGKNSHQALGDGRPASGEAAGAANRSGTQNGQQPPGARCRPQRKPRGEPVESGLDTVAQGFGLPVR